MDKNKTQLLLSMAILLFSASTFAGGLSFGPVQAVRNKVNEYNDKQRRERAAQGYTDSGLVLNSTLNGTYYTDGAIILAASKSPYTVTGDVSISDPLIIEPGVTVKFAASYTFSANNSVTANGTSSNPIYFTSGRNVPSAGDYVSIMLGNQTLASTLSHVTFEYGSSVYFYGDISTTLANCTIKTTTKYSPNFYLDGSVKNCQLETGANVFGSPNFSYCNITGSLICESAGGQYKVNNCNLIKKFPYIIYHYANWPIDATNNWWGTTSDATIAGYINCTAGSFTYTPYLSAPVPNAGPQ